MAKHTVSELDGALLDGAVALAEGKQLGPDWNQEFEILVGSGKGQFPYRKYKPSRSWAEGGPIIEREHIHLECRLDNTWAAGIAHEWLDVDQWIPEFVARNPLIAAMRVFVVSKLGETVELP